MEKEKYLIHELAEMGNVTVRTIRYYTDEGLLPQPVIQGKYAYYTTDHLRRLELIRQMKEAFLPLREIRQAIGAMTDEEVLSRLKNANFTINPPNWHSPENHPVEPGESARDYIDRIMERQTVLRYRATPTPSPPPISPMKKQAPVRQPLARENWQRIELAPGIELHVREQAATLNAQMIQKIQEYILNLI